MKDRKTKILNVLYGVGSALGFSFVGVGLLIAIDTRLRDDLSDSQSLLLSVLGFTAFGAGMASLAFCRIEALALHLKKTLGPSSDDGKAKDGGKE